MLDYKAKSPLEAFKKAVDAILISWDETYLAKYLPTAVIKNYDNGAFTFEVPTQQIADVMKRNAEHSIVRRTLEDYMPDGITVSVTIISREVQP